MNVPKPERIKIKNVNKPIEDLVDEKRDVLYPKLLEVIRYCESTNETDITFLEIETDDTILSFNVNKPYDEQINNTIEYYIEKEEYEICQELKSYLG